MSKPVHRERGDAAQKCTALRSAALGFVECINTGGPEALKAHQTEDFAFTDMSGEVTSGQQGWEDYTSYPDYRIHVEWVLIGGEGVAIIGRTTGSHSRPRSRSTRPSSGPPRSGAGSSPSGGSTQTSRRLGKKDGHHVNEKLQAAQAPKSY